MEKGMGRRLKEEKGLGEVGPSREKFDWFALKKRKGFLGEWSCVEAGSRLVLRRVLVQMT